MKPSVADILKNEITTEKYAEAIQSFDGDFIFDSDTMMEFGEVYCSLYPESVNHGDSVQVVTGYKLVRITIIEYILAGVDSKLKPYYREMLISASGVAKYLSEVLAVAGRESTVDTYKSLDIKVKDIKSVIDTLPNSVIKERFTGGVSVFYNTLYLIKKSLDI
jgi:hypothetical protein